MSSGLRPHTMQSGRSGFRAALRMKRGSMDTEKETTATTNDQAKKRTFKETPEAASAELVWRDGQRSIAYTATAGHIQIREDNGDPLGSMFCISYIAKTEPNDPVRPVTFAFNGGPGSASFIVNVGGIGPRYVVPNADRRIGPAPYAVEDNPLTLLRSSDLVFIDALGTGWSVYADGVENKRAWGVDSDAEAFARFIEAWLAQSGRWNSPLYLFGESYGTTRNAVLIGELEKRGIGLNGVVMLSAIFDWAATLPGNDGCYIQMLPTFASIAQYHGKGSYVDRDVDAVFDKAVRFAEESLAPALLLGDRLDGKRELSLARAIARFTGLDVAFILSKHLRIELTDFRQRLLADEGRVCGRLDGRFTFPAGNFLQTSAEGEPEEDPSDTATTSAWMGGFRSILANEIGYRNDAPYLGSNWENVGMKWDHGHKGAQVQWKSDTPNVAYDLATSMRHNPNMRVLVLGGRYDLATPFLGPVEDLARLFLSDDIKANLTFKLYDAGHMIYVNPAANEPMAADIEEFYKA